MNVAPPEHLTPPYRPYQPYGAAERLLYCREPEVVLAGPAGTGKSRAVLEKIHLCMEKYAGARALIVRKTRESLTESALVTFEEKVIPEGHGALAGGGQRRNRQSYRYPNGSVIVVGGMDKASRIMSTEFDLIYVQEGIELIEPEWEALTTRLRNGVMPFQQLIGDTNPDTPTHWLRRRADAGRLLMLESRHEDNPTLWDSRRRDWTAAGASYVAKLDALTGPRKDRLRFGRWVQAEGVVYEGWDAALHVIDRFAIPADWPRWLVVDFGYTHPFVCQWWARDPDGRLYRYREIYRTQRLVEDHARRILELSGAYVKDGVAVWGREPRPAGVICDHDAEVRATLEKHLRMPTVPARKDVSPGIQCVAARLRPAGDGRPRIFLMRGSLDERDPVLTDSKKPTTSEEEVDGYIWNLNGGRRKGEEPVKENDHGMDCMRYMAAEFDLRVNPGDPAAGGERPDYAAGAVGGGAAEGRRRGQMPIW